MQRVKDRFSQPDQTRHGSLQSCVRTNDLELVGDGSHLSYFEMIGNFSFGNDDYELSVELWHSILRDLKIPVTEVRCHPIRVDLQELWKQRGYQVTLDQECEWSDGSIGGNCCEIFFGQLELGNLVQPLRHSTDVGFGLERLLQVIEQKNRVNETSLFDQNLHPIVSDHVRTISILLENQVHPGNKGRNYVCRRLMRRMLPYLTGMEKLEFDQHLESERELRQKSIRQGRRLWRKHRHKPIRFWWETFGILPEEVQLLE